MANQKINLTVGSKKLLNGVELLNDNSQFPHVPTTLPLVWSNNHPERAQFLEANADRTQIQVLGITTGVATITVTDGILTFNLDINVVSPSTPVAAATVIKVLPLPVKSGDPFAQ